MNCHETRELLHAYGDGELDLVTSLALERHLAGCDACRRRYVAALAVREAVVRGAARHSAPPRLKRRLQRRLRTLRAADAESRWRRWLFALTLPVAGGALAFALWIGVLKPETAPFAAAAMEKVIYHINDSSNAAAALRNLSNHLEQSPNARIVVVAHNEGVDFLLQGARDKEGRPFAVMVSELKARGVDFRVCGNTLARRHIEPSRLIPQATLVPSGVAEIARLQTREGFRYLKP
ncbi:DsrE family protein [Pelomicrobium sp.]|jgi:anti-sigma factor (TIGR02949 family)|uniref:DsrE family protein n=1 Tax=Pelomicrobium sp. TaxID=2815319 RepID=UPI002FDEE3F6